MAFSSASDIWNVQLCVSTFLIIHEIVSDLTVWTTGCLSCRKDEATTPPTSIMCGSTSGTSVLYSTGITAFIMRDFYKEILINKHWSLLRRLPGTGGKDNEHPTLLHLTLPIPALEAWCSALRCFDVTVVTFRWEGEWGNMLLHHHNFSLLQFYCRIPESRPKAQPTKP